MVGEPPTESWRAILWSHSPGSMLRIFATADFTYDSYLEPEDFSPQSACVRPDQGFLEGREIFWTGVVYGVVCLLPGPGLYQVWCGCFQILALLACLYSGWPDKYIAPHNWCSRCSLWPYREFHEWENKRQDLKYAWILHVAWSLWFFPGIWLYQNTWSDSVIVVFILTHRQGCKMFVRGEDEWSFADVFVVQVDIGYGYVFQCEWLATSRAQTPRIHWFIAVTLVIMPCDSMNWHDFRCYLHCKLCCGRFKMSLVWWGAVTIWSHSRQVSVVLPCIMWSDAAASYFLNNMSCSAVRSGSIFSRLVAWPFASKCSAGNACGCCCMKVCLSNRWCREMNAWYARYVSSNDREIMKVLTKNAGGWSTIVDPAFILVGMFWYTNFQPISSGWNNLSRHCFSCVFLSFCDGSEIWSHSTYSTISRNLESRHSSPLWSRKLQLPCGNSKCFRQCTKYLNIPRCQAVGFRFCKSYVQGLPSRQTGTDLDFPVSFMHQRVRTATSVRHCGWCGHRKTDLRWIGVTGAKSETAAPNIAHDWLPVWVVWTFLCCLYDRV